MTHEELIAKINHMWDDDFDYIASCHTNALRAVVELHKPIKSDDKNIYYECGGCYTNNLWADCPTIQAIEKELG